jgi:hypothetical protein
MRPISDVELAALTFEERAELLRRLTALNVPAVDSPAAQRRRHRFTIACAVASLALVPWLAVLAFTLPHRYVAARWSATWVGFDLVLIACLATTAWLASRRRQALVLALIVTGTLLLCDAWFDVMTASTTVDVATSAAAAAIVELPSAALLFTLAHRLLMVSIHLSRLQTGQVGPDLPFHKVPLLGVRPPGARSAPH